jgi:hypothetical protein
VQSPGSDDGEHTRERGRAAMRRERPDVDPPADEELPERETTRGEERSGEAAVDQETGGGVEREAPVESGDDAGEESPPRDADRAALLP